MLRDLIGVACFAASVALLFLGAFTEHRHKEVHMAPMHWDGGPDAETDENEERGDICMALRAQGFQDEADEVGGMSIRDARAAYREVTGTTWRWRQ